MRVTQSLRDLEALRAKEKAEWDAERLELNAEIQRLSKADADRDKLSEALVAMKASLDAVTQERDALLLKGVKDSVTIGKLENELVAANARKAELEGGRDALMRKLTELEAELAPILI